jgi:hypothetical protein
LQKYSISCNPKPICDAPLKRYRIIDDTQRFLPVDEQEGIAQKIDYPFAKEYAISGWFKWSKTNNQFQVVNASLNQLETVASSL